VKANRAIRSAARTILRWAPADVRERCEADAIETIDDVCARACDRAGLGGAAVAGLRELASLTRFVWRAKMGRWPAVCQRPSIPPTHTRTPNMLLDDVRHAIRRVRARPGAALVCAAMLGVGIGLSTAMFTIVDALLIRPVPFPDADHLATISTRAGNSGRLTVPAPVLRAWKDSGIFSAVEAASFSGISGAAVVDTGGEPVMRGAARVSPGLFAMLGVRPIRGRAFLPDEGRAGTADRVILSETVWQSVFQSDPDILGRSIRIDGRPHQVVGIMPADFRFPQWDTVIWQPLDYFAPPPVFASELPRAYARWHGPVADASARATEVMRATEGALAKATASFDPLVPSNRDEYAKRAVTMLAAGVGLVFLVLCANVSGLLLAQLTARRREYSMCSALGASRARLIREAATESALVGLGGVTAGIGIAWALVALSRSLLPDAFLLRSLNPVNLDARALVAASVAGLVATFLAGLLPAWIGTAVNATGSLRSIERGSTETRAVRLASRTLLVGEIALACMLLAGAALLIRSFMNLSHADRGLRTAGVMTAWLSLPPAVFPDTASRMAMASAVEQNLSAMAGIERVALSFGLPPAGGAIHFGDDWRSDVPGAAPVSLDANSFAVRPDFFALYDIALIRGRTFQPGDDELTAIVGERFAARLWPGFDPVGRSFTFGKSVYHVVGLAKEIRLPTIEPNADLPQFYTAFTAGGNQFMVSVRCAAACPSIPVLRRRLEAIQASLRINNVARLEDAYAEQLARPRAAAGFGGAFAVVAVLTAAGGLLSVLTYAVGRRRREFGIRTALGASPAEIRRLVLRDGLLVTAIGVAVGAGGAWALSRVIASLEYGVSSRDPMTWTIVLVAIGATALVACWRPARQAMRVDPVILLREE